MLNKFLIQQNEIRMNFIQGYYQKTINKCRNFIKLLKKEYGDIRLKLCFYNYYIGKSYKNLNNIKQAFRYIKKSIKYAANEMQITEARIALAEEYEYINNKNKSIKNYKKCSKTYKELNMIDDRRKMIFQIAKLLEKPKKMKKIIDLAELINTEWNEELNKSITEKYMDLIFYYFKLGKIDEVKNLLHDIKNQDIKEVVTDKTLGYLMKQIA